MWDMVSFPKSSHVYGLLLDCLMEVAVFKYILHESLLMHSQVDVFKYLLFSLCVFHGVTLE